MFRSATYILRNSILIKLLWHQSKANLTTYYILRQIKSEERLCKNYSFVLLKKRFATLVHAECTHFATAPLRTATDSLGCGLVLYMA